MSDAFLNHFEYLKVNIIWNEKYFNFIVVAVSEIGETGVPKKITGLPYSDANQCQSTDHPV